MVFIVRSVAVLLVCTPIQYKVLAAKENDTETSGKVLVVAQDRSVVSSSFELGVPLALEE